jgi:hypothetical protein
MTIIRRFKLLLANIDAEVNTELQLFTDSDEDWQQETSSHVSYEGEKLSNEDLKKQVRLQLEALIPPGGRDYTTEGGSERRLSVPILIPTNHDSPSVKAEDDSEKRVNKQMQIKMHRQSLPSATSEDPEAPLIESFKNEESATQILASASPSSSFES